MARPAIEKEKYIGAIEQMIQGSARLDEITATKLQKMVGGQYSRCVQIVEEYLTQAKAQSAEEEAPPMPVWFKDFVAQVQSSAEGTWFKIASEMRKSVDDLTASFNEKKVLMDALRKEDLQQIVELEAIVKEQDAALIKTQEEVEQLGQAKAKVEGELAATRAELKDLAGRHKDLEKEKANITADLKVAQAAIEQHKKTEYAQEQKTKELETVVAELKSINKTLNQRAIVAETRTKDLEGNLNEIKLQVAKEQAERVQMGKELKEVTTEKTQAEKAAQVNISDLEKQLAVSAEKEAGLMEHVKNLKQQLGEFKKKN